MPVLERVAYRFILDLTISRSVVYLLSAHALSRDMNGTSTRLFLQRV